MGRGGEERALVRAGAEKEVKGPSKKSQKFVKDDAYSTKLRGAGFFEWSKEWRQKQQQEKKQHKEVENKGAKQGKMEAMGHTMYSDYVKKMYSKAKDEVGSGKTHRDVMLKIATWWQDSVERATNLDSKCLAQELKKNAKSEENHKKSKKGTTTQSVTQ
jgi:hypothetical protein